MIRSHINFSLVRSLSLMTAAAVVSGCGGSQRIPVTNASEAIPLQVWVVLGDNESLGQSNNEGCRLSKAQITTLVNDLIDNSSEFGNGVSFTWPGCPVEVFDNQLARANFDLATTGRLQTVIDQAIGVPFGPAWVEDAINVYFTGSYGDTATGMVYGFARDPAASGFPVIAVNDGGGSFSQNGTDVPGLRFRRTIEHETAHYLARFANRTFGSVAQNTVRDYNDGMEHVTLGTEPQGDPTPIDFGANNNVLLRGNDVGAAGGRKVNIPGGALVIGAPGSASAEKGEISTRILSGLWNSP